MSSFSAMKKFDDYHIAPIKCETKMGGTSVMDWLYKVNGVLYPHKFDYLCPALLKRMGGELRTALIGLYYKKVPPIAQKKKDEILQKGKVYYLKMKELERDFKWEPADAADIQKVLRYRVSAYLKQKPDLNMSKAIGLLKENEQVYNDYYKDASQYIDLNEVSTDTFKSMQKELQAFISSSLGISLTSAS